MVQIVWVGNLLDSTGYAKATREYVLALHSHGFDVKVEPLLFNIPQVELPPEQQSILQHLMAKPKTSHHKVYIIHQIPDIWRRRIYPTIGFTYWETSKIPPQWVHQANQTSRAVFLSSNHNLEIFRQSGINVPMFHIRPCLSPVPSNVSQEQAPGYLNGLPPFRFLSVCSWIERKGYRSLLQAFWEEFTDRDNVALVIKTAGSGSIFQELEQLKASYQISHPTAPVHIDLEIRKDSEMDALYRHCQAFVLPSRGEGVCYPLLEAAVRGMPIIATAWGGHMDFLHEHNSYPIPCNMVPVTPQPYYYGYQSDQLWAEVSVDRLKAIMRHVFEHYEEARVKGAAAQHSVQQHVSPAQAVQDIASAVHRLMVR